MLKSSEYEIELVRDFFSLKEYLESIDEDSNPPLSSIVDLESYADKLLRNGIVFGVYREEKKIEGIIAGYCNDFSSHTSFVSQLYVDRAVRRLGLGKTLLRHFEKFSKEYGMCFLKLMVNKSNVIAIEFYKENGLGITGESETQFEMTKKISNFMED